MKRVTGIGGIFIKAKDPEALRAWREVCDTMTGSRANMRRTSGLPVATPSEQDDEDDATVGTEEDDPFAR